MMIMFTIKIRLVFEHEAYDQSAHRILINHSTLIHNWCDLMGLEYKEQQPQIVINYAQQQLTCHWKRDEPTMVLQTSNWCICKDRDIHIIGVEDIPHGIRTIEH